MKIDFFGGGSVKRMRKHVIWHVSYDDDAGALRTVIERTDPDQGAVSKGTSSIIGLLREIIGKRDEKVD